MANPFQPDDSSGEAPVNEALHTLRLLAEMPAPAGLEGRVHRRVALELTEPRQRGFWSLWKPAQRLQFAGAALLMMVIGASSWTVFRGTVATHPGGTASPVAPAGNGFGPAGIERRPSTVKPIKVPPSPHKKPDAGRVSKPAPRAAASPEQ